MEKVRQPVFFVEYEGKDITSYISQYIKRVVYSDCTHGTSDEIEIVLDDSSQIWKGSWYPQKGDKIKLKIGYDSESLIDCGTFQVDDLEAFGPPDEFTIYAISTPMTKPLREIKWKGHEETTLRAIVEGIAAVHGYEVVGVIDDVKVTRISQNGETDLWFLRRLAERYGYVFKISDGKMVFYKVEELETANISATIDRKHLMSYSFRDRTHGIYKACTVSYLDPNSKTVMTHTAYARKVITGDTLVINERCENLDQAQRKAMAALSKENAKEKMNRLTLEGNPRLLSGINLTLTGLHTFDGKYAVETSRHIMAKTDGYTTELEVRKLD